MFPNIDPKKMQAMMKQMGIGQEEIEATKVTIETPEKNIIISNPSVMKINMQGNTNFQISGDITDSESISTYDDENDENSEDESEVDNTEEDIKTIMEKTNCLEEEARLALKNANGDLTEALISLN